jgi:transcriptional regulator with GAF, ATPase, and Fis domain/Tfp pilus assembly protein PilF
MDLASKLAETVFKMAVRLKHDEKACYFRLKQAGFHVHASRLDESEKILREFSDRLPELNPKLRGLFHHFNGLLNFHRGMLAQANTSFENAIQHPHPLARVSLMNLGIVYGRMGEFQKGEDALRKAIRRFTKVHDSDSLAYAYCNLGILLKQKGQLLEARKNLHRSMHLSSGTENRKTAVMAMIGLANTFAVEGRSEMYLLYYKKAYRLAEKARLPIWAAYSLNNAGLQYAIQGKLALACRLLDRAIKVRTKLGLHSDIAASLENLGLAYFFSHRYAKAEQYLRQAGQQFASLGLMRDAVRIRLFKIIGKIQKGIYSEARKFFEEIQTPEINSFERGLWHYVDSSFQIMAKQFNRISCRDSIHEAELIFRRLSNLIWLGKTFELKSRYYCRIEHYEKACSTADIASEIFSRIGAQREVLQVQKGVANMKMPENFMESLTERLPFRVLQMVRDVLSERDPGSMIKKILNAVLELTDMERAVLILSEDPPRIFASKTVGEEELKEIQEISLSALRAASRESPFICTNVPSDPSLSQRPSILSNQIMSIVCLPLRTHDETIGYLYLDSREGIETVASIEKTLLEIFSSVIALALDTTMLLNQSMKENEDFKTSLGLKDQFPQIMGTGTAMQEILGIVRRLLPSDLPVLITGETGTGKELIARVLHYCGGRKNGPFVAINCSALTESILESELFGHEKGAFTGATNMRRGLFEEAQQGTLFLDEIGDMPLSVQAKFLRVLQDGEFRRVGGNKTLYTNARIILATNRNLEDLVNNRLFREDLYYRIRVARVNVPPLRERKEDIALLASYFLKSAADAARRRIRGFSPDAIDLIKQYPWPGNVRQLKNEIERIVALTESDRIYPSDFDPQIFYSDKISQGSNQDGTLREMERGLILERLQSHNWNILHAARSLGLTRNGLYSKMRIFNIPKKPTQ